MSKNIQNHTRTIAKESNAKTVHILWGWDKIVDRQLIVFATTVLLITSLFLGSSMSFDYSVMGKPVCGPVGKKMYIEFFLTNVLLDR